VFPWPPQIRGRAKQNKTKHTNFLWLIITLNPTSFSDTDLRGCRRSSRAVERTPSPTHPPSAHP
jgi:hypothetical protein